MSVIHNLSMRIKLALLLLCPVLGLAYFSWTGVVEKRSVADELAQVSDLSGLAVELSALLHETQKERGMTAGFLGSRGVKFKSELPEQRRQTEQRVAALEQFLTSFDAASYSEELKAVLDEGLASLARRDEIRQSVTALQISTPQAIGYYTTMNAKFLGVVGFMPKLTRNAQVTRETMAYQNFLQGKERAGIERAALANTFGAGAFALGMFRRFSALVAEQQAYMGSFRSLATAEQVEFFEATMSGNAVNETERLRKLAFDNDPIAIADVDPTTWFGVQTKKTNLLKKVEDNLSESIGGLAGRLQRDTSAFIWVVVSAFGSSLLFALVILQSITRPLGRAVEAATTIAEGDLSKSLETDRKDEIGTLLGSMEKMRQQLTSTIGEIRSSVTRVRTASQEIAAGNSDLSDRISSQAASVEETSSTMEQMTASVQSNSASAEKAAQLAVESGRAAEEGGHVVAEAVAAMNEIMTTSKQIGEIIGVIDEITFQTNLLALNASIEAERAGEHGRGFAVVATEVRTLAERSATAAKDINRLIATSVEQAEKGSGLVNDSGAALDRIVESVKSVNHAIAEISSASGEQATGISEINSAIGILDNGTQHNAALVEQMSAASESLKALGESLHQSTEVFVLADGGKAAPASPGNPPPPADGPASPAAIVSPGPDLEVSEEWGKF
ncbi:MAG: nitrate- and nitrite sensing domain-containing protein [Myxococcota bacterium]|jgi:methyl-accepting chemotaxis protein|nr:nitrate- and nitrite sensing domain-containing protein [Myxococcota bacterium]